ncbi:MAG: T9SS type A sorting domain-containing protein [Bacteroidetes bacterium]|nr:T9SS type A sorting domain-containing protein [Bacteroidota bacterium]
MQAFNVLIDTSAYAPWFWWSPQTHFPLSFILSYDANIGITEFTVDKNIIYPNPCNDELHINTKDKLVSIEITNLVGEKFKPNMIIGDKHIKVNTAQLKNGIYILKLLNNKNQITYEKFCKID